MTDKPTTRLHTDNLWLVSAFWSMALVAIIGAAVFFWVSAIAGALMMAIGTIGVGVTLAIGHRILHHG